MDKNIEMFLVFGFLISIVLIVTVIVFDNMRETTNCYDLKGKQYLVYTSKVTNNTCSDYKLYDEDYFFNNITSNITITKPDFSSLFD